MNKYDYGFDPSPYSYGGGGGIPYSVKDVALVQPVEIKPVPVGSPIQAIPLHSGYSEPFGITHNGLSHASHAQSHHHFDTEHDDPNPFAGIGAGKQYGHGHGYGPGSEPIVVNDSEEYDGPGPIYDSGPIYGPPSKVTTYTSNPIPIPGPPLYESGPIYDSGPIYAPPTSKTAYSSKPISIPYPADPIAPLSSGSGKVVEHIHHHIHHTPSVGDRPSSNEAFEAYTLFIPYSILLI